MKTTSHGSWRRRVVAAMSGAALGLVGLVAASGPAMAAGPGNIDPAQQGSITIHKFAEAGNTTPGSPDGTSVPAGLTPLAGVVFTATAVPGVDLTTQAGWAAVAGLTAADATGTVRTFPATNASGVATLASLPVGVYYVQETDTGGNAISDKAAPFFVTIPLPHNNAWLYDVHVYPKNSVTAANKTVSAPNGLGQGSQITYTITVDIPKISGGTFSKFSVVDNLPAGVSYVSGTVTAPSGGTGFLSQSGQTVTFGSTSSVSAALNTWLKAHGGETLTISVDATVNDIGALVNTANVNVNDWSANPSATTRWGGVDITKTDQSGNALSAAEFQVFASEADAIAKSNPISVNGASTFTSGDDGKLSIDGLYVGKDSDPTSRDFWIVETKAPAGFVIAGGNVAGQTGIWKTTVTSDGTAIVAFTVQNPHQPPVELPLTGASGQLLLTVGGLGLLLLALGVLLITRRRSHQEA